MTTSNDTVFNFTYDSTSSKYGYLNSSGTFIPFEDSSDATATADKILSGFTAYSKGTKLTGSFDFASATSATASANEILAGYTAWVNGVQLTGNASSGVNFEVASFGEYAQNPSSNINAVIYTYKSSANTTYTQLVRYNQSVTFNNSDNFSTISNSNSGWGDDPRICTLTAKRNIKYVIMYYQVNSYYGTKANSISGVTSLSANSTINVTIKSKSPSTNQYMYDYSVIISWPA